MKSYIELCKLRISIFASFSAATGFMISSSRMESRIIILTIGVFFLACGSSALNQYQERTTDALMPRTKGRPIPSGRIEPAKALYFAVMFILAGSNALLLTESLIASCLGLFAALWYNGVYTFLKRKTAFAAVPGALVGAIPPAIGWAAGGGSLSDPKLIALCFFFFMWQVPHFWLLLLNFGEEYEKAGLPSLTTRLSKTQLSRIIFNWIAATAVSCLFISGNGIIRSVPIHLFLIVASLWLVANGVRLLRRREFISSFAFRTINIYMLAVLSLLSIDKLL